jgi:hypothetical protein
VKAVSLDLAFDELTRLRDRTAILRRHEGPDVHSDKLLVFQAMEPASGWIGVQDVSFQIFDENGVRRLIENCSEQAVPFLEFVCVQINLHEPGS